MVVIGVDPQLNERFGSTGSVGSGPAAAPVASRPWTTRGPRNHITEDADLGSNSGHLLLSSPSTTPEYTPVVSSYLTYWSIGNTNTIIIAAWKENAGDTQDSYNPTTTRNALGVHIPAQRAGDPLPLVRLLVFASRYWPIIPMIDHLRRTELPSKRARHPK